MINEFLIQVRDYVKRYASLDTFDKILANGSDASHHDQKNGFHKNGHTHNNDDDKQSETSELSQTSDIDHHMHDDDEDGGDMALGSDEEEKQQHEDVQ